MTRSWVVPSVLGEVIAMAWTGVALAGAMVTVLAACSGADQPKSVAAGSPSSVVSSVDASRGGFAQRTDAIPDGVYRKNVTEASLVAVGHEDAFRDFGVQTLTVRAGEWHWTVRNPNKFPDDCGSVSSTDRAVEFREGAASCVSGSVTTGEVLFSVTWRSVGDRLYLKPVYAPSPDLEVKVGGEPWRKIG